MEKNKKGSTVVTAPITILVSVMTILLFTIFVINSIVPFIMYEKLQLIAHKYMYVVEKYGYLTDKEEKNLIEELYTAGFKEEELSISAPKTKKEYGNLIELKIAYSYEQKIPIWNGIIYFKNNNIPMQVRKVSVSKI